jgi:hypothetical protein
MMKDSAVVAMMGDGARRRTFFRKGDIVSMDTDVTIAKAFLLKMLDPNRTALAKYHQWFLLDYKVSQSVPTGRSRPYFSMCDV